MDNPSNDVAQYVLQKRWTTHLMDLRQICQYGQKSRTYQSNAIVDQTGHKIVSQLTPCPVFAPSNPFNHIACKGFNLKMYGTALSLV